MSQGVVVNGIITAVVCAMVLVMVVASGFIAARMGVGLGVLVGLLAIHLAVSSLGLLVAIWTDADMNDPETAFLLGDYKQEKFGRGGPGNG